MKGDNDTSSLLFFFVEFASATLFLEFENIWNLTAWFIKPQRLSILMLSRLRSWCYGFARQVLSGTRSWRMKLPKTLLGPFWIILWVFTSSVLRFPAVLLVL
ncbi:hypothetical protein GALMADRAFT_1163479 [Galerina marginata CBS 339.88]|uniref:Uncharacterized protein n=1 Tax=Galerina marginata (strain CBS 339.88) TaxID=685588 RepID=A0A067T984_GALM3|nr:hypothetical protein GALMADRAFT_1163479 [Galerina marginata CBS 339.88]